MADKKICKRIFKISLEENGEQKTFMQYPIFASSDWALTLATMEFIKDYEKRMDERAWAVHGVDLKI